MPERCPEPEVLAALAEGHVLARTARRVEAHLEACPGCRAEVAAQERALGRLAEAEAPGWDPDLLEPALATLRPDAPVRERPVVAAAAVLALVALVKGTAWLGEPVLAWHVPGPAVAALGKAAAVLRPLLEVPEALAAVLPPLLAGVTAYGACTLAAAALAAYLRRGRPSAAGS